MLNMQDNSFKLFISDPEVKRILAGKLVSSFHFYILVKLFWCQNNRVFFQKALLILGVVESCFTALWLSACRQPHSMSALKLVY